MTRFNRRNLLKATAVSGSGLAALAYSPKPTLAASDWTVNSPSEVSNDNGELSSLEIPSSGFSFSLDYSGLGSGSHSINFQLEAKLSSASSFESVFSDSFSVEGDSGTVTESNLSTSFPVDLLANTSMSASDFEEPNSGDTETTTVDLRVSFNWSDGSTSTSDSANDSFDVSVTNTGGPSYTLIDDFEDSDVSEYSGDTGNVSFATSPVQNGSYSLVLNDPGSKKMITSTNGLNSYPSQGDTWRYWSYAGTDSNHLRMLFGYQDSNNYYYVNATVGPKSESFHINKKENGSDTQLSHTALNDDKVDQNKEYEFEISWGTDGSITATIYESETGNSLSTISATDSTFTSGGIGWAVNSSMGSSTQFDFCRIL